MKVKKYDQITCLGVNELPKNFAGVSVYKGLLVLFDSDFDDRIFLFLKGHYEGIIACTLAVFESGGTLQLFIHKDLNTYTRNLLAKGEVNIIADTWKLEVVSV